MKKLISYKYLPQSSIIRNVSSHSQRKHKIRPLWTHFICHLCRVHLSCIFCNQQHLTLARHITSFTNPQILMCSLKQRRAVLSTHSLQQDTKCEYRMFCAAIDQAKQRGAFNSKQRQRHSGSLRAIYINSLRQLFKKEKKTRKANWR